MTDGMEARKHEVAILAGGCFWCLDGVYREVEGVLSVTPGYCGGQMDNPEYGAVCEGTTGHAEAVRLEFDPEKISFRDLLEIFFVIHDPTTLNRQGGDVGTQYRSAIFPTSDAQVQTAQAMLNELDEQRAFPNPIVTHVEKPGVHFWPAEEIHYDFFVQHPEQPYCQYVVAPKVAKFREKFAQLRRK